MSGPLLLPVLCRTHVEACEPQRLGYYVRFVTMQMLLLRGYLEDPDTQRALRAREHGVIERINAALQHIGCLACALPVQYQRSAQLIQNNLDLAVKVARQEADWPITDTERASIAPNA